MSVVVLNGPTVEIDTDRFLTVDEILELAGLTDHAGYSSYIDGAPVAGDTLVQPGTEVVQVPKVKAG